jgi:VWFA-related protein
MMRATPQILAWCLSLALIAPGAAQTPHRETAQPPRFRTGAAGVSVDVLVTDDERPVAGLTAADFELTDGNVPQQIDVTSLKDRPIDVIVVLDTSEGLREAGLRHLIGATDTLLASLRKEDRAALVTCSQAVVIRSGLTTEHARVREIVRGVTLHGRTSVIDAAYAATTLQEIAERSSLLLVFSDGIDNSSWLPRGAVLDIIRRSAVVPYAVALTTRSAPELFLNELVKTGGGVLINAEDTGQIERRFAEALDSFRHRYVLTYTPRGVEGAGWHPLTIKVKDRRYRIRARSGYVMP